MSRFNTDTFRSLNESISRVQNPQAALDEAMEYTAILEEVILSLCEELEIDPQALVEDVMTAGRAREHIAAVRAAKTSTAKKAADAKAERESGSSKIYGKGGKVRGKVEQKPSGLRAKWSDKNKSDRKWDY